VEAYPWSTETAHKLQARILPDLLFTLHVKANRLAFEDFAVQARLTEEM